MNGESHVADDLMAKLAEHMESFTPAERIIANYIIANRSAIAFETASSLAQKLSVSAVTVGRFCRGLGYTHFRALKAALKMDVAGVPWLVGPQLGRFVARSKKQGEFRKSLELDVAGIVEVYTMAETPEWKEIVLLLCKASSVHIVGFQTERGIAALLGHMLQYVRPHVQFADMSAGNHADVLLDANEQACLVIVETRRYSRNAVELCAQAREKGIRTLVITDKYNYWAREYTPYVIAVSTDSHLFWNSEVPLACAANLLANFVVAQLGTSVEPRLERFSELYQKFVGHVGKPRAKNGSSASVKKRS